VPKAPHDVLNTPRNLFPLQRRPGVAGRWARAVDRLDESELIQTVHPDGGRKFEIEKPRSKPSVGRQNVVPTTHISTEVSNLC